MGRIAEALRRASSEGVAPGAVSSAPEGSAEPIHASPWDFDEPRSTSTLAVHPRSLAPAARPTLQPGGGAGDETPSVRLESQLALSWPQPFAAEAAGKLVTMSETSAIAVAQYRQLADALYRARGERGARTVVVASALAGEGKTLTAVNLALTLSGSDRERVLLVDADFRNPRVHQLFQVSAGAGLSEGLRTSTRMRVVEVTERLVLLPAGRGATAFSADIGSDRMSQLLEGASRSFDWIVLDSPPILMHPAAAPLARMADAVVLVVNSGTTPRALAEQAAEAIGRDRLIGILLNRAPDAAAVAASDPRASRSEPARIARAPQTVLADPT